MDQYTIQAEILAAIRSEREYQANKWGAKFDAKNTAADWVAYIVKYAADAAPLRPGTFNLETFKTKMLKVAAIAVAAIEAAELNNGIAKRHYD